MVLAAGNSVRFGENKLKALFWGKSLFERALAAVPLEMFDSAVVVTQYADLAKIAENQGFTAVHNPAPEKGISLSLRLGLERVSSGSDAAMFMVADQPMLKRSTVEELIKFFKQRPGRIVAPSYGESRGSPVIFPKQFFDELSETKGDSGGKSVIMKHKDHLELMPLSSGLELVDVDTVDQLTDSRRFGLYD